MLEAEIQNTLNQWFDDIREPSPVLLSQLRQIGQQDAPFDATACSMSSHKLFYIYYSQEGLSQQMVNQLMQNMYELTRQNRIEQAPVILFTLEDNVIKFGFLIFWDYDRCYVNRNINLRELNDHNVFWLDVQLRAHRQRIVQLPEDYLRVVKTININSDDFAEAEIIYFRKFHGSNYRMQTPPIMSDQERFNRLFTGTPEDEYPKDEIDELILENIRTQYPNSTCKSALLLFDVDLIKYRHKKDYNFCNWFIDAVSVRYNETGELIGQGNGNFSLGLDVYYQPNYFKRIAMGTRHMPIMIDENVINAYLVDTYEPLSSINI